VTLTTAHKAVFVARSGPQRRGNLSRKPAAAVPTNERNDKPGYVCHVFLAGRGRVETYLDCGDQTPILPLVSVCSVYGVVVQFGKIFVAVLRNKSRAAHWSPLVHCTMKTATMPVLGLTDKSVP
jgi:hypothetical protein